MKDELSAAEEADNSVLDELIGKAVLDHYADAVQPGQIHVESHVVLAEDRRGTETVTVYLLVLQEIYSTDGESLTLENADYIPSDHILPQHLQRSDRILGAQRRQLFRRHPRQIPARRSRGSPAERSGVHRRSENRKLPESARSEPQCSVLKNAPCRFHEPARGQFVIQPFSAAPAAARG